MNNKFERNGPEYWKNIYLIGFMGSGKSTVAKELSKLLDLPVIELDEIIETYYKKSISELFEEFGEKDFRNIETLLLITSITGCHQPYDLMKGAIFSCGGGTPLEELNVISMQNSGRIVYLTASPKTILERVSGSTHRPLLKDKMNLQDIEDMLEIRAPYYEDAADITIDTENKTPADIAGEIMMALNLVPILS